MREEIPKWAWYNGMFLFKFAESLENQDRQDIRGFYDSFRGEYLNGIDFPLKNQGVSISLLYMLLVVPREMWENQRNQGTQFQFNSRNIFEFEVGHGYEAWDFIRCMRNSVAHANFDMNQEGLYAFWNERENGEINFKVKVTHSNLFRFITEIGQYYINEVGSSFNS